MNLYLHALDLMKILLLKKKKSFKELIELTYWHTLNWGAGRQPPLNLGEFAPPLPICLPKIDPPQP